MKYNVEWNKCEEKEPLSNVNIFVYFPSNSNAKNSIDMYNSNYVFQNKIINIVNGVKQYIKNYKIIDSGISHWAYVPNKINNEELWQKTINKIPKNRNSKVVIINDFYEMEIVDVLDEFYSGRNIIAEYWLELPINKPLKVS